MVRLYYNKVRRLLRVELPRELWVVQAGVFLNYLGWGCVMPFEVIYLHDGRGFSLGIAGLVVGVVTGLAVVAAPLAGPLIDRVGSRAIAAASLVALGAGFAGLAFAHTPQQALVAAAAAGIGNGGYNRANRRCSPRSLHRRPAIGRARSPASHLVSAVLSGAQSRPTG